jgi:protein-S-isoprenylcysteine O-methyltransferase
MGFLPACVGLAIWLASELALQLYTRKTGAKLRDRSTEDRGSFWGILAGLFVAVIASLAVYFERLGPGLPAGTILPGSVLVGLGITLRGWALITLGRNFSQVVRTSVDQQLVTKGVYRWIRHPSYTGNLLITLGLAVLLGPVFAVLITAIAVLTSHLYRIRVEEMALRKRFPDDYPQYTSRTWSLIPGVY